MSDAARQPINALAALIVVWIGAYWMRTPPPAVHAEAWSAPREAIPSPPEERFDWTPPPVDPAPASGIAERAATMPSGVLPHERDAKGASRPTPTDPIRSVESPGTMLPEPEPVRTWTVRRGDTLGAIAQREYGSIVYADLIFEANRDILRSPDDLDIGMVLRLPDKPED